MENDSFSKVRLESSLYSSKKGLGILSAVFFGGVLLCGLLGLSGPTVYDKKNYVLPTGSLSVTCNSAALLIAKHTVELLANCAVLNCALACNNYTRV
eukprot:6886-Heterococcus_DN1.PRE.2